MLFENKVFVRYQWHPYERVRIRADRPVPNFWWTWWCPCCGITQTPTTARAALQGADEHLMLAHEGRELPA